MKIKIFLSWGLVYVLLFNQAIAGVIFSEILPNTTNDSELEYIELYNSGSSIQSLSGYILKDKTNKEYIFNSGAFLTAFEKKKYFRSETKILLNNSNEEIFIFNNSGQLLDSVNYSITVKGEKILIISNNDELNLLEPEILEETNTGNIVIENETGTGEINTNTGSIIETGTGETNTNTGSIIETGTGEINTNTGSIIETGTGETNTNTGSIIETNTGASLNDFNLIYSFQNPSYLLGKDNISDKYICDNSKDDCKINLDLRKSFSGIYKEKDFFCEIDFGFNGWLNGQENKCNPSTIIFPKGSYDLKFKIIEKSDPNIFYTGGFIIENNIEKEIIEIEKIVYKTEIEYRDKIVYMDKEDENKTGNEETTEQINIEIPDIIIQSGLKEGNICKKEDCKINLKYEENNKLERCEWKFEGGNFKGETNLKCNPGYVSYGLGKYKIKLKVYQKNNKSNYKESYLEFENKGKIRKKENPNPVNISTKEKEIIEEKKGDNALEIFNKAIILENNDKKELGNKESGNKKGKEEETKIIEYKEKVKKEFTQKISKLKSGIKIYGKTIPNSKILIKIEERKELGFFKFFIKKVKANYFYETFSDKNGDYKILITEFNSGKFIIKNNIIDELGNNIKIEKEKQLNLKDEYIQEMKEYVYTKFMNNREKYSDEVGISNTGNIFTPVIEIQGKIGKNKSLKGNILTCYEVCSVNFDARKSLGEIDKYIWDFGNGEISELENPGYIKYKDKGVYKISLTIFGKEGLSSTEYFYVIFTNIPKVVKSKEATSDKNTPIIKSINDDFEESIEMEKVEEIEEEGNVFLFILYVLIFIFGMFLVFMLLKKEKLI